MIQITAEIAINESEILMDFVRSSGPGGQNVNKVSTAVQLRFDIRNSSSLPEEVKQRLISLAGNRVTEQGILTLDARRFRTQGANRQDAIDRLVALLQEASYKPAVRHRTKPTRASHEKRLEFKRRRSISKTLRRETFSENDE